MLLAGAVGLVFAWTKSLPVSVGRPELRIVTHGIETLVLIPLVLVFGSIWDATGAAAAVLDLDRASSRSRGLVALARLHREHAAEQAATVVKVLVVSGIWPPDVGGPASHAPEVADVPARPRPRGRGGDDCADARPPPEAYPVHWISRGAARRSCATLRGALLVARARGGADVVYSTGHVRPDARRLAARRHAARGQADRRPRLRARACATG